MKIIIGGGTGLVGQILVPELLQSGHEIYVIGRDEEKLNVHFQVQFMEPLGINLIH